MQFIKNPTFVSELIGIMILAYLLSYLLIPFLIRIAKRYNVVSYPVDKMVDVPEKTRLRTHDYEVPLLGGIYFFITFSLLTAYILVIDSIFLSVFEKRQLIWLYIGATATY